MKPSCWLEDEPELRATIKLTLAQLGYRVLEAGTGAKASEVWREHHDEIHLLLTDLVMPDGMTGKELGQRLIDNAGTRFFTKAAFFNSSKMTVVESPQENNSGKGMWKTVWSERGGARTPQALQGFCKPCTEFSADHYLLEILISLMFRRLHVTKTTGTGCATVEGTHPSPCPIASRTSPLHTT